MKKFIEKIEEKITGGGEITREEALGLINLSGADIYELFPSANRLARHFKGWEAELCGIINAKSGKCPENCAFCAQSGHHRANAPVYSLLSEGDLVRGAQLSQEDGADHFGIVTSGTRVNEGELAKIALAVSRIRAEGKIIPCASLGILGESELLALKEAGLGRYHHNLETARSFFPKICTTHDYEEDVNTVRAAKKVGLEVCSGGIFGIGESAAQRVEMAFTLKELEVDSVPINFLVPVAGTPLEGTAPLRPLESLKIIAVYRFILPRATIKVCAGRERNLGDMSSWIFYAGANAMMVGNFLTSAGRDVASDLKMTEALGFSRASGRT